MQRLALNCRLHYIKYRCARTLDFLAAICRHFNRKETPVECARQQQQFDHILAADRNVIVNPFLKALIFIFNGIRTLLTLKLQRQLTQIQPKTLIFVIGNR